MSAAILTVDDQQELLDSIALTLRAAGYTVLAVSDGFDALEVLAFAQRVDLILADIAMRRMNGYQFYQQVRENRAWVAIPFLFLTARAMDSDIRYGKELGVDDYLTKPIQPRGSVGRCAGQAAAHPTAGSTDGKHAHHSRSNRSSYRFLPINRC